MTRFKTETPLPQARESCLTALVGFPKLPAIVRGLLERCELTVVEVPDVRDACRMFETVVMDAVVLDTRCLRGETSDLSARKLLKLIAHGEPKSATPQLVVLTSATFSRQLRQDYLDVGAVLLPRNAQTYRHIARAVRQLCGWSGQCCVGQPPSQF
ncbi:MAG: hypothetical protein ABS36_12635 [Acidobacteria bacterium SCN 69-37]|nr:MAG: hypothetical protein ABS36_12635 [Acidobacteria bacterium SCN 69-37]